MSGEDGRVEMKEVYNLLARWQQPSFRRSGCAVILIAMKEQDKRERSGHERHWRERSHRNHGQGERHDAGHSERRRSRRGLAEISVWVPVEKVDAVKHYIRRISERRTPLQCADIIEQLRQHRHTCDRFGVVSLSLFGSCARNEAQPHSDIDLLVEFLPGHPSGLFEFVELKRTLEGLLGRPVDLTTLANLKPTIRTQVLRDVAKIF